MRGNKGSLLIGRPIADFRRDSKEIRNSSVLNYLQNENFKIFFIEFGIKFRFGEIVVLKDFEPVIEKL